MFKIKVLNNISPKGLDAFDKKFFEIGPDIENPDAIIVRSADMHDMDIPNSVQIIGRAGAGTNNIPITQMTTRGIPVLNTPGANANAVKELVITGMLLACRNITAAWDYARNVDGENDEHVHEEVEKNKKRFSGFELPGKTLAVIGLGQIGVRVANAARDLGMHVVGYDPAMTVQNAWMLNASVKHAENIDTAIDQADFISLHVPLNDHTRHLINEDKFKRMKKAVVLLNFARDGLVELSALEKALGENHVRNYVCDFPTLRFKNNSKVICLPHLGASTQEAEENCAVMTAKQIQAFLLKGHIENAVNFPNVHMSSNGKMRLAVVNLNVPNMLAQISGALSSNNINIVDMINKSRGEIAYTLVDLSEPMNDATLKKIRTINGVVKARIVESQ